MKRATIALAVAMNLVANPAQADEVFFDSIQPVPKGMGEGYEAIFKHGNKETGLALFYNCQALVNQPNVTIYGAFLRNFKDNSNELLNTMPNAVREAQEACKAKGITPNSTPSSQNFGTGTRLTSF